jgi:hypothetical protein
VARTVVEWSLGKDPDAMIEVWSTAALITAVIAVFLEDPDKLQLALRALGMHKPS